MSRGVLAYFDSTEGLGSLHRVRFKKKLNHIPEERKKEIIAYINRLLRSEMLSTGDIQIRCVAVFNIATDETIRQFIDEALKHPKAQKSPDRNRKRTYLRWINDNHAMFPSAK